MEKNNIESIHVSNKGSVKCSGEIPEKKICKKEKYFHDAKVQKRHEICRTVYFIAKSKQF